MPSSTLSPDQTYFLSCYRGRQSKLHHMSYMRMSKVLLSLKLINLASVTLEKVSILDYGFGAGTFFHYCPRNALLHGVEQDSLHVSSVSQTLIEKGFAHVDLQRLDLDNWENHPLLKKKYDIILCSHVLEHLPSPVTFLKRLNACLKPNGVFLGLVPLNERVLNTHHTQHLSGEKIQGWINEVGWQTTQYVEADPWIYWVQPLYNATSGWKHKAAQILSLSLGIPATLLGPHRWHQLGKKFSSLTGSQPTQAAFIARPISSIKL
jgi:2-polyprenyl-3-methyl-5-hydroxy-6-metoxy-1,4-benzoquinol methylase